MPIKYKILYKLCKDENIVAYKIYAGVFVFFISPDLLNEGLAEGIILPNDNIDSLDWWSMLCIRGREAEYRIEYAIEHSNIEYLKSSLDYVNKRNKKIEFDCLFVDDLIFTIIFDIETGVIDSYREYKSDIIWHLNKATTSLDVIHFLIHFLDRDFMNSRDIIYKIKENKGRQILCGPFINTHWIRFKEDRALSFKDVAYPFELERLKLKE